MARSHHRKKHKEQLRQFKQKEETGSVSSKSKASGVLAVGGAVFGLAVGYIATQGDFFWVAIAALACSIIGYIIGRKVDSGRA